VQFFSCSVNGPDCGIRLTKELKMQDVFLKCRILYRANLFVRKFSDWNYKGGEDFATN
jgi:hypothetical protein